MSKLEYIAEISTCDANTITKLDDKTEFICVNFFHWSTPFEIILSRCNKATYI